MQSDLNFRVMSLSFKLRDLRLPRKQILKEAGIKSGFRVLDYGCGPGSYVVAASELVGPSGKVYALDIHPLAIQSVQSIVFRKALNNVETILSDCQTGLPEATVDVALLYDAFHDLKDPNRVLEELYRVLRPDGSLSFNDHHMKKKDIMARITAGALFHLTDRGRTTYTFAKEQRQ